MPVATKPKFGIDENRLSFGILILLILAGVGYGLWQVVEPLIETRVEEEGSRRTIADQHYTDKEFLESAELYQEILDEDPWNGYIIAKLGLAHERVMDKLINDAAGVRRRTDGKADKAPAVVLTAAQKQDLENRIESHLVKAAAEFEKLEDHARFRSWGTWRLIRVYAIQAKRKDDDAYATKAIEATRKALKGDYAYGRMFQANEVAVLRNYPEYNDLLKKYGIRVGLW